MNTAFVAAAGIGILVLIWIATTYNRFVRLNRHVEESWSDIDVELKRRYELIPNLVETVKGYAAFERDLLERIVRLRNRAMHSTGTATSQAVDESALMIGMKQLFAVVEDYTDIKANAQFLALQKELGNTEDRIAAARRFFNGNVRDLNVLLESFPASLVGKQFNFQEATFFELDSEAERVVPHVAV
ncbi:MAG: LemA family protein [Gemmatimonadales bacterium]